MLPRVDHQRRHRVGHHRHHFHQPSALPSISIVTQVWGARMGTHDDLSGGGLAFDEDEVEAAVLSVPLELLVPRDGHRRHGPAMTGHRLRAEWSPPKWWMTPRGHHHSRAAGGIAKAVRAVPQPARRSRSRESPSCCPQGSLSTWQAPPRTAPVQHVLGTDQPEERRAKIFSVPLTSFFLI